MGGSQGGQAAPPGQLDACEHASAGQQAGVPQQASSSCQCSLLAPTAAAPVARTRHIHAVVVCHICQHTGDGLPQEGVVSKVILAAGRGEAGCCPLSSQVAWGGGRDRGAPGACAQRRMLLFQAAILRMPRSVLCAGCCMQGRWRRALQWQARAVAACRRRRCPPHRIGCTWGGCRGVSSLRPPTWAVQ